MVLWRAGGWLLTLLAASACASAGPGPARPRTDRVGPAFGDVRKAAVFRQGERRGRDVLDGVAGALASRGWTVTDEPPPREAARDLERLRDRLDPWVGPALDARDGVVFGVSEGAGELVRAAGLDAVAFSYRFVRMPAAPLGEAPYGSSRREAVSPGAVGAIVLVSARDEVARVEWGGDPTGGVAVGPANAAEAIDALMRALDAEREQEPPAGEGPPPVVSPPEATGSSR